MPLRSKSIGASGLFATGLILIGLSASPALSDEPQGGGRLGRLFRFGPGNAAPAATNDAATAPASTAMRGFTAPPTLATPPATPDVGHSAPGPRIAPQPRVSKPPTEADPIVTRISIGRSDGGGQFGMFLQVFADGTVMDSEGVHRVGPDVMKPLVDVLHVSELSRLKGHCGAPSTDFIEQAHVIALRAVVWQAQGDLVLLLGQPPGLRPFGPPASRRARRDPDQARRDALHDDGPHRPGQ